MTLPPKDDIKALRALKKGIGQRRIPEWLSVDTARILDSASKGPSATLRSSYHGVGLFSSL